MAQPATRILCILKRQLIEKLKRNQIASKLLLEREVDAVMHADWTADAEVEGDRTAVRAEYQRLISRLRDHMHEHGC
jgi:hypothetical protein